MVSVKKWPFFSTFFLGNIGQKNVVYDILEWKNAFLGYKNTSSKSGKIDLFPQGLTHTIGPKRAIFGTFFFRKYKREKCLLRYSRAKKRLLRL